MKGKNTINGRNNAGTCALCNMSMTHNDVSERGVTKKDEPWHQICLTSWAIKKLSNVYIKVPVSDRNYQALRPFLQKVYADLLQQITSPWVMRKIVLIHKIYKRLYDEELDVRKIIGKIKLDKSLNSFAEKPLSRESKVLCGKRFGLAKKVEIDKAFLNKNILIGFRGRVGILKKIYLFLLENTNN